MVFLGLAFKSLRNRLLTTLLTILSIALSTTLLLSVERTRRAAEEGFTQAVSQVDLLVGGRTGPINLILYTVFNMGSASNNVSWKTYQEFRKHPAVEWTIPYSLGDGHRGFRVVATDENFYEHYRFRGDRAVEFAEGKPALDMWDVVIGSEVEQKLKYQLGQKVVIAHGVTHGEGVVFHDDKPFHVVGILKPTGSALDQSLYISLYGMEAIHIDWTNGAAPNSKTSIPQDQIKKENIRFGQITSFFIRTKSRIQTLALQREINTYPEEPLLAVIPGATLSEFWRGLSFVEAALKMISWMVVAVALVAMLIALLTGLNERRREMAILRSIGASPLRITGLLVFESAWLTVIGVSVGLIAELSGFFLLQNFLEAAFGLSLQSRALAPTDFIYLALMILFGIVIGLVPAWRAARLTLKDGLSVKI